MPSAPTQPSVPLQDPNLQVSVLSDLTIRTPAPPPTSYSPHHPPRKPGTLAEVPQRTPWSWPSCRPSSQKELQRSPHPTPRGEELRRAPGLALSRSGSPIPAAAPGQSPRAPRGCTPHLLAPARTCWNATSTKKQEYAALWLPFRGPPLQSRLCRHQPGRRTKAPGRSKTRL